jgi:DedD protein
MNVRIRERLIGALVLVALIVLFVPALLKGPGIASQQPPAADTKSVEIILDGAAGPAESERLVPEPQIAQARPEVPVPAEPKSAEPTTTPADTATAKPESPGMPPAIEQARPAAAQQPAWAVQLGAFSSRSKADKLVARLRARGYSAFVLEYRAGGQLLHRVRVGPEQDRARAVAIAERLRNDGFQPVVAPHP